MIHYLSPAKAQKRAGARDAALCRGPGHRTTRLENVDCPACLRALGTPEYIRAQQINRS